MWPNSFVQQGNNISPLEGWQLQRCRPVLPVVAWHRHRARCRLRSRVRLRLHLARFAATLGRHPLIITMFNSLLTFRVAAAATTTSKLESAT